MCVPLEQRTLQGGLHDAIYILFEKHEFCEKFVKDGKFITYMGHQIIYRTTPDSDRERFGQMVEGVNWFVEVAEWKKEIGSVANDELLNLLEKHNAFVGVESFEKGPTSYHQLCYHLGMITFDYMELIR